MTLYLLPNLLGCDLDHREFFPSCVDQIVQKLDGLIAESESEGRRFLKRFKTKKKPHEMPIALSKENPHFLLEPLLQGESWGLISDAGLPCIADPGWNIVKKAKEQQIPVRAVAGPSSILLSLMQSGLPGQQFIFHGYIPKTPDERKNALKAWEKNKKTTHIFIEAPYRNAHTLKSCLEVLQENTLLCVATSLTLPEEWIFTETVSQWQKMGEKIFYYVTKKPTIFLLYSV